MLAQVSDPVIMVVKRAGDVRIHTFVASFAYSNIANATHIIETRNQLVLVDGQFLVPYARAFRDYADSLGKPIERLYLSHRHPDHWFGLGTAFSDVAISASHAVLSSPLLAWCLRIQRSRDRSVKLAEDHAPTSWETPARHSLAISTHDLLPM